MADSVNFQEVKNEKKSKDVEAEQTYDRKGMGSSPGIFRTAKQVAAWEKYRAKFNKESRANMKLRNENNKFKAIISKMEYELNRAKRVY